MSGYRLARVSLLGLYGLGAALTAGCSALDQLGSACVDGDGGLACEPPPVNPLELPPESMEKACAALEALGLRSTDLDADGDCFVREGACETALGVACPLWTDCDEGRPDTRPLAGEACNGRDDDCDGRTDESFALGEACETACGVGVTECAVGDAASTACSTRAGQSGGVRTVGATAQVVEVCDGVDDDCDGRIDEACGVSLEPARVRSSPVACGDDVVLLEDDALVVRSARGEGPARVLAAADRKPFAPACGAAGVAWLELSGPCSAPTRGPEVCPGRLVALAVGQLEPVELALGDALGRPLVSGQTVLWHSDAQGDDAEPRVWSRPITGVSAAAPLATRASDPAAADDEASPVAVRRWSGARSAQVAEVLLLTRGETVAETYLRNPVGPPGPPTLDDRWLVWALDEALWAVPLDDLRSGGFQLTVDRLRPSFPRLGAGGVVFLDTRGDDAVLLRFDLDTGASSPLTTARVWPDDFSASPQGVLWVEQGLEGPTLHRRAAP